MENSGVLGWRRWSRVKRFSIISGLLAGALTTILNLWSLLGLPVKPISKESPFYGLAFAFMWMVLLPTNLTARALGLAEVRNALFWFFLQLLLNTTIGFLIGAIVGGLFAESECQLKKGDSGNGRP